MTTYHKQLAAGRWLELTFFAQMANIGSEVHRTINYKDNDSKLVFERVLELLDLTITNNKNRHRLKELCRVRECIVDYFMFDNQYKSSDKLWKQYFDAFNWAYANEKNIKNRS